MRLISSPKEMTIGVSRGEISQGLTYFPLHYGHAPLLGKQCCRWGLLASRPERAEDRGCYASLVFMPRGWFCPVRR